MGNELDEMTGPVNQEGRDINVIDRQLKITVGVGSKIFVVALWILGILPGLIFLFMSVQARNYLRQLQQKLQSNASQIDNFLEQRVMILQNAAAIVNQAVSLDKEVMIAVAGLRAGVNPTDEGRNQTATQVDNINRQMNIAFERYPELRAHNALADAMQQNSYLQREITAARELYNDTVLKWNTDVYRWPTKMIQAAKMGYTTRVPFTTSAEVKQQARGTFF